MGYMDNLRGSRKPNCWGSESAYDENDQECSGCRYQHSCRDEVEDDNSEDSRVGRARHRNEPPQQYSRGRGGVEVRRKGIEFSENETGVERFFKDAAAGGFRGVFYEMYEFWRHYRIR